ncbi:MAG: DUF2061 domain-containing protein [Gammaproteobacteria bacterium]|nr:DUF2061 domain-containing protein [Gammaproteobacteria bacterium]
MESTQRTISKAISWQLLGLVIMSLIGFCFTGSITGALTLSLTSMLSGLIFYVIHEKIWQRIQWGKTR